MTGLAELTDDGGRTTVFGLTELTDDGGRTTVFGLPSSVLTSGIIVWPNLVKRAMRKGLSAGREEWLAAPSAILARSPLRIALHAVKS